MDSKLCWTEHLAYITKKFTLRLNIIKSLSTTWWGGHPQTLLMIYKAILRSTLEYGSICIASKDSRYLEKLGVLQRRALRHVTGLRQSTPNKIVLTETRDLPLEIRIKYLAYKYILKILSNSDHQLHQSLQNLNNLEILKRVPFAQAYKELIKFKDEIHSTPKPLCYLYSYNTQWFKLEKNNNNSIGKQV